MAYNEYIIKHNQHVSLALQQALNGLFFSSFLHFQFHHSFARHSFPTPIDSYSELISGRFSVGYAKVSVLDDKNT